MAPVIEKAGLNSYSFDDEDPRAFAGDEPVMPNVTKETDPETIKWREWLAIEVPSTKPHPPNRCATRGHDALNPNFENPVVELFECAHNHSCGIYRPSYTCRMRDPRAFCRVCSDAIRRKLVGGRPLLLSYTPNGSLAIHSLRMGGAPASLDFNQRRAIGLGAQMLLGAGAPARGAFAHNPWFYDAFRQEFRFLEFA